MNLKLTDCLELQDSEGFSLIYLDPPYSHTAEDSYRVLRPGGRLCVNIDMTANMGDRSQEYYRPLYADFVNMNRYIGIDNDIESVEYSRQRIACAIDLFA